MKQISIGYEIALVILMTVLSNHSITPVNINKVLKLFQYYLSEVAKY